MPGAAASILTARALATAHRRLAELLEPGARVLDVGCGTGAITRGMAEAVGPTGRAAGVDRHVVLIEKAHALHRSTPGLWFLVGVPMRSRSERPSISSRQRGSCSG